MTHHIEESAYQGYMWKSDEPSPKTYDGDIAEFSLSDGENPFIIEGQLYDKAQEISTSIKCIDGKYIINKYDGKRHQFIDSGENAIFEEGELEQYIPSTSLDIGDKVMYFTRLWKAVKDNTNYGFEALCPSALVFKGFCPKIKGGNND